MSTFEGYVPPENRVYYEGEIREATGVREVSDTWWHQVIEGCGGRLLANASFSGSVVEGTHFPAGNSDHRVSQLAGADGESPDVVLVYMGINDYGWGGPDAQICARTPGAPKDVDYDLYPYEESGTPIGNAQPGEPISFGGAYASLLRKIRAAHPKAEVWCVTLLPGRVESAGHPGFCYQMRGIDIDEYNDMICAAALAADCHIADIRAFGFDYDSIDGTHPTKAGMEQVAAMVLTCMGQESLHRRLFDEGLRSERLCCKSTCTGCPYVEADTNTWKLVCNAYGVDDPTLWECDL